MRTAGAQGATNSPGCGCRGEKLANRLPKELQKPVCGCPAEPSPFQKPPATCDKGWHPCAGWKWICGNVVEQCRHIPAEPCLWGTLLEPCLRFPGNSKSLCGGEISWRCWEQAVDVGAVPRDGGEHQCQRWVHVAWCVLQALVWLPGGGSTWQVTDNISVTLATSSAKASPCPGSAPLQSSQKNLVSKG